MKWKDVVGKSEKYEFIARNKETLILPMSKNEEAQIMREVYAIEKKALIERQQAEIEAEATKRAARAVLLQLDHMSETKN